ncbi:calmodulin binding transcription activator 1 [Pyrus ussuriensis x Pyrus communis]|uniref:Calmodulin binding transcription activator 1 n=1 Tax=Pyrus ussuriensis x Pyrus communis TaxID=2448454 RepID=A0A5N5GD42_9ROSA|nr:calmodulin binding transcription activator 1 [Pyrus ussuriensis x Pyrus communis]
MDSNAMFTDMAFKVPWERYKDHNFVMHGWNKMVYDDKNWIRLNTGLFLLRNCLWSLDILDIWASMGPKAWEVAVNSFLHAVPSFPPPPPYRNSKEGSDEIGNDDEATNKNKWTTQKESNNA